MPAVDTVVPVHRIASFLEATTGARAAGVEDVVVLRLEGLDLDLNQSPNPVQINAVWEEG